MPIATRILKIRAGNREQEVPVTMLEPQAGPGGGWCCSYLIAWPDDPRRGEGWGIDAFQALHLTLERIGLDLYTSPYHKAGELVWEASGDGYGFPVPPNLRDARVGADRRLSGG